MASVPAPDYLLETSFLSRLLFSTHPGHNDAVTWERSLALESRKLVSVVAIAELRFGLELARQANRHALIPDLEQKIRLAEQHDLLPVTPATGREYAMLKANLVRVHMPNKLQKKGNAGWGNPESWIDEFTGRSLGIQENDLWQCAQAVERSIVLAASDNGIAKIAAASPGSFQFVIVASAAP